MGMFGTAKYVILQLLGFQPDGKKVWGISGTANDKDSAEQVVATFPKGEATYVEREKLEGNGKPIQIKKGGNQ